MEKTIVRKKNSSLRLFCVLCPQASVPRVESDFSSGNSAFCRAELLPSARLVPEECFSGRRARKRAEPGNFSVGVKNSVPRSFARCVCVVLWLCCCRLHRGVPDVQCVCTGGKEQAAIPIQYPKAPRKSGKKNNILLFCSGLTDATGGSVWEKSAVGRFTREGGASVFRGTRTFRALQS